jgi:hypothetical protein
VEVENRGPDALRVRAVEVAGAGTVPVASTVAPGDSARLPVRLRLDPHTPPGRREVEVVVGDARTTAVLEVAEHARLRITPPAVAVAGAPGAAVTARVVMSNRGNVPVPLDRLGAVTLDEDGGVCRSLDGALRAEGEKGFQAVLDEAVRRVAGTRVDQLRVRAGDPSALEPGETRAVDLELRLPPDMTAGRTYSGMLRLVGASLLVQVTAEGAPSKGAAAKRAASRARSAS